MQKNTSHRDILVFGMLVGIQIVVLIFGACFVYILYREISSGGPVIGDTGLREVRKKISQLEAQNTTLRSKLNNFASAPAPSQPSGDVVKLPYQEQQLLNEMVSNYYLEKNSRKLDGGLQVNMSNQLFFSVFIPKEIYSDFSTVRYSGGNQDTQEKYYLDPTYDMLFLTHFKPEGWAETIDMKVSHDYISSTKGWTVDANCKNETDKSKLAAAVLFKYLLEPLSLDISSVDLCQYLIPQKEVSLLALNYYRAPTFANYKLNTKPEVSSLAFSLDTKRLFEDIKDKNSESHLFNVYRYYIVLDRPRDDYNAILYRTVQMHWWNGIYHEASEAQMSKIFAEGQATLLKLENAVADKMIVAPPCDYGCAY